MSVARYFETMEYGPAPEADTEARGWLKRHEGCFGHFVGGGFVAPKAGAYFDSMEPATGALLARVAQGDAADVDAAVAAARKAQGPWWLLAVLEALDNGNPIRETRDLDVPLAARHFYHHAGWAQLQERELADQLPVGVVGQIIPWNFPLLMLAWKVAPGSSDRKSTR